MIAFANREVLVLNKGYQAVGVVSLERAIVMLFSEYKDGTPKACIIDCQPDLQTSYRFKSFTWSDWSKIKPKAGEEKISAANDSFRIPTVVLLTRYEKLPIQKTTLSRRALWRRDNHQCQYCALFIQGTDMTMDHILPRSRGGLTTWNNVVVACWKCNAHKADRTPKECGMRLVTACEKCATVTTNTEGKHHCQICKATKTFLVCKPKKPFLPICRTTVVRCPDWHHFINVLEHTIAE